MDQQAISMDGSAFESTQHIELMRIVDDRLYRLFYALFSRYLPENEFFSKNVANIPQFLDTWLADALDHVNIMFVCLPGIRSPAWPDDVL